MGPAYRIVTERLLLRCFAPTDAAEVRDLIARSRAHLDAQVPLPPPEEPLSGMVARLRDLRARFDQDRELTYALLWRQTGELIGIGNLDPLEVPAARSVGGWLRPDKVAAGGGAEAAAALIRAAFEVMGLSRVEIRAAPDNVPVTRLAVGLGLRQDGEARPLPWAEGVLRPQVVFTLDRTGYASSKAASVWAQAFDAIDQRVL